MEGLFLDHDNTTPATIAGGREIDEQGDHQTRNCDCIPSSAKPMHHRGIPESRERQEDEAKDWPRAWI